MNGSSLKLLGVIPRIATQRVAYRSIHNGTIGLIQNNLINAAYDKEPRKFHSNLDPIAMKSKKIEEEIIDNGPSSRSYFTGNSVYYDLITGLDQCILYYTTKEPLYANKPSEKDLIPFMERKFYWLSHSSMASYLKCDLTKNQYRSIIARLDRLASSTEEIESLPNDLREYIEKLSARGNLQENQKKVTSLDELGRAYSVGKRKEASVRCWLVKGDGKLFINGSPLADYFKRYVDKENCILPLALTNNLKNYNAWMIALGGGTTGQSQAASLALAKSLIVHQPELEPTLKEAKLLYRDPRVVERKKTGQPKARKKFTWVKR